MNRPSREEMEVSGNGGLSKLVSMLVIGILVFLILKSTGIASGGTSGLRQMLHVLEGQGINEKAGFIILASLLVFAGMPRLLFFALGGMMMGFTEGLASALLASLIGSYLSFRFMRWAGRDWITRRFSGKRVVGKIIGIQPEVLPVAMVRQLPVSNVILNACLSMSRVKDRTFLIGSLIGFIPQGVAAALIGSGSSKGGWSEGITHLAAATTVIAGIPLWTAWMRSKGPEPQSLPAILPE